jgi:uncharacterized protein
MMHFPIAGPLGEGELVQLGHFLADIDAPMNPEILGGFFVALICTQEIIMPSEYLPYIIGEDHSFDSEEQALGIVGIIARHWNATIAKLRSALEQEDAYVPILADGGDAEISGTYWAAGFLNGMRLRPDFWAEVLRHPEVACHLVPIAELAREVDPYLAERSGKISPEQRHNLVQSFIWGVVELYQFNELNRNVVAHVSGRRGRQKIGRNNACPCGSGQKYKRCCALGEPTIH